MLGVAFLKDIHRKIYKSALIGTILFVLAVLAIFFISRDSDFDARLLQGGWLGVALGYPLLNFLGFSASMIVLMVLIVISLLIALNIPVHKLLPWARKEYEVEESTVMPLKDNVVVKRGSQNVDIIATKKADEPARPDSQ